MIIQEIPDFNPIELFEEIRYLPYSFIMESTLINKDTGRYTIIGAEPNFVINKGDPFDILDTFFRKQKIHPCQVPRQDKDNFPVSLGFFGYLGYECGKFIEKLPAPKHDDIQIPDFFLGFYNKIFLKDNVKNKSYVISDLKLSNFNFGSCFPFGPGAPQEPRRIHQAKKMSHKWDNYNSTIKKEEYKRKIRTIKEYIRAGDVYQVNLSHRISTPFDKDPWELYKVLRTINPVPFSAFFDYGDFQIISNSPERFLKIYDGIIETRPMKGTRPRGKIKEQDRKLKNELANSKKDKAEHVMIVDLERNDLGRICMPGSIQVKDIYKIEEYSTVFQMISVVKGKLLPDINLTGCIKAGFPGGSITGAPKIRAMEIINELEQIPRKVYTGAIGFLGLNKNANLSIAIRTAIVKNNNIYFHVGGGIVADSDPDDEYQETIDKAQAFLKAIKKI